MQGVGEFVANPFGLGDAGAGAVNYLVKIVFTFDDNTTKTVDLNHYHGLCIRPNTVHVQGLNMDNYPG